MANILALCIAVWQQPGPLNKLEAAALRQDERKVSRTLSGLSVETLKRMERGKSDSVALLAYSARLARTGQPTGRLVGFVEGRLRVSVPLWWQRSLQSKEGLVAWPQHVETAAGLTTYDATTADWDGATLVVRVSGASVRLRNFRDRSRDRVFSSIAGARHGEDCYVAPYGPSLGGYELYGFHSGVETWRARIPGSAPNGGAEPKVVGLFADDRGVTVFTAITGGVYLSVFDRQGSLTSRAWIHAPEKGP